MKRRSDRLSPAGKTPVKSPGLQAGISEKSTREKLSWSYFCDGLAVVNRIYQMKKICNSTNKGNGRYPECEVTVLYH